MTMVLEIKKFKRILKSLNNEVKMYYYIYTIMIKEKKKNNKEKRLKND